MIRRPWQIWLLYILSLIAVVPAMVWLTIKAVQLDRAEAIAHLQIERDADISQALWQMDTLVAPLLAQEAARPHFEYHAFPMLDHGQGVANSEARQLSRFRSIRLTVCSSRCTSRC